MCAHALQVWQELDLSISHVACYLSRPEEPDTQPLITACQARGLGVLVPILGASAYPGDPMTWALLQADDPVERGPFGIAQPQTVVSMPVEQVQVMIIPALAVDAAGNRLGQGGGYFDRALSGIRSWQSGGPLRMGWVFADEFLPALPAQDHDERIDVVVTPDSARWCVRQ